MLERQKVAVRDVRCGWEDAEFADRFTVHVPCGWDKLEWYVQFNGSRPWDPPDVIFHSSPDGLCFQPLLLPGEASGAPGSAFCCSHLHPPVLPGKFSFFFGVDSMLFPGGMGGSESSSWGLLKDWQHNDSYRLLRLLLHLRALFLQQQRQQAEAMEDGRVKFELSTLAQQEFEVYAPLTAGKSSPEELQLAVPVLGIDLRPLTHFRWWSDWLRRSGSDLYLSPPPFHPSFPPHLNPLLSSSSQSPPFLLISIPSFPPHLNPLLSSSSQSPPFLLISIPSFPPHLNPLLSSSSQSPPFLLISIPSFPPHLNPLLSSSSQSPPFLLISIPSFPPHLNPLLSSSSQSPPFLLISIPSFPPHLNPLLSSSSQSPPFLLISIPSFPPHLNPLLSSSSQSPPFLLISIPSFPPHLNPLLSSSSQSPPFLLISIPSFPPHLNPLLSFSSQSPPFLLISIPSFPAPPSPPHASGGGLIGSSAVAATFTSDCW
ncbi:unnamed protein product [Closterium sp. NIES-65]|nr:unnamed protein product [Closterium sp. NIES-65]